MNLYLVSNLNKFEMCYNVSQEFCKCGAVYEQAE